MKSRGKTTIKLSAKRRRSPSSESSESSDDEDPPPLKKRVKRHASTSPARKQKEPAAAQPDAPVPDHVLNDDAKADAPTAPKKKQGRTSADLDETVEIELLGRRKYNKVSLRQTVGLPNSFKNKIAVCPPPDLFDFNLTMASLYRLRLVLLLYGATSPTPRNGEICRR